MAYERVNWKNSSDTPLNADNLNKMDEAIYELDEALTALTTRVSTLETNYTALEARVKALEDAQTTE